MLFVQHPNSKLQVSVVLPAKNEEDHILSCLEALRNQRDDRGRRVPHEDYEVLLLVNNSDDATFEKASRYQARHPVFRLLIEKITFSPSHAHIGTARRLLMDTAYNRFLYLQKDDGVIASTDSDSIVAPDWLFSILREMGRGCDVIGGAILTEMQDCAAKRYFLADWAYQNLIVRIEHLLDERPWNPWPSHFQCFGANLSVRCRAYQDAGRLPEHSSLEDLAFVAALELRDAKIRRSPDVVVHTSPRQQGRVERGLSQQLHYFQHLGEEGRVLLVESADAIVHRFSLRHQLRLVWEAASPDSEDVRQSDGGPLPAQLLMSWLRKKPTFGQLWQWAEDYLVKEKWFDQWPRVDIDRAIRDLHRYEQRFSQKRNAA